MNSKQNKDEDIWNKVSHTGRTSFDPEEKAKKKLILDLARNHVKTNRSTITGK